MLKNVLSLLLSKFYSKKESSLVAHQAMPQDGGTTISTTTVAVGNDWVSVADFTAPTDGYCMARIRPSAMFGFLQISAANGTMNSVIATNTANEGQWVHQSLPIRKGASVKVQVSNGDNILVKFFSTIGGGYQALSQLLLQGGVLCRLSRLYSSLRRSSCRVRRNGSEVKVFSQTQIPEQRSLLTTLRLNFIRLQVMDGLHSVETGHRSMSALLESWERVALTLKVISELQLRFGRGIPLVSIARRTICNRLRQNSFPAKGQRNTSLVGGASC